MNKYKIVIKQIIITPELFKIISTDGINFISKINKGSIEFKIYNEDYQQVNLCNINEGDIQFEVYHVNSYTLKDEPQSMSLFAKGRFNIHYDPMTEIKSIKKSNDYNFRNVVKAIHANTQTIIKSHLLNKAAKSVM